jgi:hypothetical protein
MPTEKTLQAYLISKSKQAGILADKLESKSRRGWPDVLLLYRGRACYVECKHPNGKGKLSKNQRAVIQDIKDHGGWVEVVESSKQADKLIDTILTSPVRC